MCIFSNGQLKHQQILNLVRVASHGSSNLGHGHIGILVTGWGIWVV